MCRGQRGELYKCIDLCIVSISYQVGVAVVLVSGRPAPAQISSLAKRVSSVCTWPAVQGCFIFSFMSNGFLTCTVLCPGREETIGFLSYIVASALVLIVGLSWAGPAVCVETCDPASLWLSIVIIAHCDSFQACTTLFFSVCVFCFLTSLSFQGPRMFTQSCSPSGSASAAPL